LTQQNSDKKKSGENSPASPSQKNGALFGKSMMVAIIGIVVILIVFLVIMLSPSANSLSVPMQPCAEKVIGYANENLVLPGTIVTFKSVAEKRGMYEIHGTYQSQDVTIYTTKDCTMLFTNGINMSASVGTASPKPTPAPIPVKTARPSVDLYVMAFCPYGTQAESAMKPVVSLLGSKADIQVRYITNVRGSTVDSVQSLHGLSEAQEDLRQICIQQKYPAKFWDYLDTFNARCYPLSQNLTSLNACWRNTTASLGIDTASIETCSTGFDGLEMLKTAESDANQNGATASPTLLINGVKYSGARTPDAYKTAICNSFDTAPVECGTTLASTQTEASAGGCG
jgi:hypothetical protein